MTTHPEDQRGHQQHSSLATAAARNLATTTKTPPQMQGISPRWLLRVLPWIETTGGAYRVNRRATHTLGDGRVEFVSTGPDVRVIPAELREIPLLRDLTDEAALSALADAFTQREYTAGEDLTLRGEATAELLLIAHGRLVKLAPGKYDDEISLGVLADGDHAGDQLLTPQPGTWGYTLKATTRCTVLALTAEAFQRVVERSEALRGHLERVLSRRLPPQNRRGEADVALASGHSGEAQLPGTFVDYELSPREYELSVAQTVLRVHSRVTDIYNHPMNQLEEQLRLTVEALRERQEHEMVNNRGFGLLHNADLSQRLHTRSGPPTPDDMDELISRRRKTRYLLAHPRAIAAIGRECSRRGVYPGQTDCEGTSVPTWRGVPLLPCDKIPIREDGTSSVLAMRTGQEDQGVVGLHQTGIPDELHPSLNVRFMGIDDRAVLSYLVSAYFSAAVLVPDALGILEDVEL
ncbi:family 2B encapsulin nanocompartment shell protein [Streptomyces boncukensis]|uniref:Cyclic nucleotide-binding domain-containing protein n=1 Tax=Streptomyces boncukensis TaxID=2711219 RepID=A0A6G4WZZ5_9ACTN|nr:family 2B encapsulin nanocompartment shell protein [Streptomyces boncukensis]NGO70573.1 cyclic nucleotide-binding domain-containing protein [Streptomyces boncukensis]